jgi:hypothetical protein
MREIFISYDRESRGFVASLADDIEALGHSVWYDEALSGGQSWWDQILAHIRACDVFVFALTPSSLESVACGREYEYAHALGKPILPVLIAEGVSTALLPEALSQIHFVDYRNPNDKSAALEVGRALNAAAVLAALPDPLPAPPAVPVSYLGALATRVVAPSLSYEEQTALVVDIKTSLRDSATADDARQLLLKLKRRPDLLAKTEKEIDELLQVAAAQAAGADRRRVRPGWRPDVASVVGTVGGIAAVAVVAAFAYWQYADVLSSAQAPPPAATEAAEQTPLADLCYDRTCFSLRYNEECDIACAEKTADVLRKAFHTFVNVSRSSPLGPPGCIGYREDIGANRQAAELVQEVLGQGYYVGDCTSDGFAINVRARQLVGSGL